MGRTASLGHLLRLLLFVTCWLLPLTWHGLSGGKKMPGLPSFMLHLTNVSCLFTHPIEVWNEEYLEIQKAPGMAWEEVPVSDYFGMRLFGSQTRLGEIARRRMPKEAFHEAAAYVRDRYAQRHPGQPAPFVVRLVTVPLRPMSMGPPVGPWLKPPLSSIPVSERRVWMTRIFSWAPQPGS